ncbi:hypothetical protein [Nocardia sp. NBC_01388]|uniref:hypothetical protein n=1 Tax=Nocardia sp. NBC_01388 TaxID=2903596 RepID=UPI0032556BDC
MATGGVFAARRMAGWRRRLAGELVVASVLTVAVSLPWKPESQIEPAANESDAAAQPTVYGPFGRRELGEATAAAYTALPPDERANAVVIGDSYWQASSLDTVRRKYGLPAVYSPSRGFGYFGTPPETATTVLWVGGDGVEPRKWCTDVTAAGRADARLGIPGVTRDITLWRCDHPHESWSHEWPNMRHLG